MEILNVFNTWTLQQIFWETKTFFKKLEYRFSVESTEIENASFPYKTVISEANVKTSRMLSTKWAYHKERSFASNFSFLRFFFFFFILRTSWKELIWRTNDPNAHISAFCERWSFIWRFFFPVSILNSDQIKILKETTQTTGTVVNVVCVDMVDPLDNKVSVIRIARSCWSGN